jgi:hypothetical protein
MFYNQRDSILHWQNEQLEINTPTLSHVKPDRAEEIRAILTNDPHRM